MSFTFTEDQARRYYEARCPQRIIKSGASYMTFCPFHENKDTRAMSINFVKGVFRCHTENIGGGMVDFEKRLTGVDDATAYAKVCEIAGISQPLLSGGTYSKPDVVYQYVDEQSRLLFEVTKRVLPDGKKRISNRRPAEGGGWDYKLDNVRRVLYRLPEVITAREVLIVEGEKCADAVRGAFSEYVGETDACVAHGFTATTSPHGAGKWHDDYAPFFAGKKVTVVPDNDEPGRAHMERVAASIARYAVGVRWLAIPDLPEKGDVADYLETHNFGDLQALVKVAPSWRPPDTSGFFVSSRELMKHVETAVDWRVEGVIEKGTSGFIIALPKSGKSVATTHLAVCLASGTPWLDLNVSGATRVALVSREDAPGLTGRRLKRAILGMGLDPEHPYWDDMLVVNTRAQSRSLLLDNPDHVVELITVLREKNIEFVILDVFNKLHQGDENDNGEMRAVLDKVEEIRREVGCQCCIIHHSNKDADETKTLSQLARGASAIAGFAEFIIGLRMVDEEQQIRQARFETKSSEPLHPFYWKIRDLPLMGGMVLERTEYEPPVKVKRGKY